MNAGGMLNTCELNLFFQGSSHRGFDTVLLYMLVKRPFKKVADG